MEFLRDLIAWCRPAETEKQVIDGPAKRIILDFMEAVGEANARRRPRGMSEE